MKNQISAVSRAPQVKERHCGNVFFSGEKKKCEEVGKVFTMKLGHPKKNRERL